MTRYQALEEIRSAINNHYYQIEQLEEKYGYALSFYLTHPNTYEAVKEKVEFNGKLVNTDTWEEYGTIVALTLEDFIAQLRKFEFLQDATYLFADCSGVTCPNPYQVREFKVRLRETGAVLDSVEIIRLSGL